MPAPDKTEKKQRHRFQPGKSANPNGRPRGARNRTTQAVDALFDGEAEALTRKAIDMALQGEAPFMPTYFRVPENIQLWSDHIPPIVRNVGTSAVMVWEAPPIEAAMEPLQTQKIGRSLCSGKQQ